MRRAVGAIAGIWLLSQAATVALVTLSAGSATAECVCAHGAEATCPMHHHSSTAGTRICAMQDPTASVPAWLHSLLTVVGHFPASSALAVPVQAATPSRIRLSSPRTVFPSPDPPPPRA